jgi:hypothetical protein
MHTIPGLFLHSNVDYSIKTVTHLFGIEKSAVIPRETIWSIH